MPRKIATILLSCAGLAGCVQEFDPYNELIGFRVLAVRADRPTLASGERTVIDALVHPPADGAPIEYSWSWCPFRGGADTKYDCAVSEAELQRQIDEAVGPGAFTVPPYALSSTASATYEYELPPQLFAGLCAALQGMSLPEFVTAPDCDGTFEITIRLVAKSGDKEIVAVKELALVYQDGASVNTNPRIGGVRYWPSDQDQSAAIVLDPAVTSTLTRDKDYMIELDIDEESAELVVSTATASTPKREILFATWFTEGGSTDSQRTSFIDGEIPFENLRKNELTTPRVPDYPGEKLQLYFVLRDTRGGVDFIVREVVLGAP